MNSPDLAAPEDAAGAEAERERAEAEAAAAAMLARFAAINASATPRVSDEPIGVVMAIGPTLRDELAAAGLGGLPVYVAADRVQIDAGVSGADRARIEAVLAAHDPTRVLPVDLVAYAKAARDAKEVGGITVQGVPIATDDRSKILISGARDRALDDPTGSEAWSATDGKTYVLPAAAILALSKAVGAHVSECFKVYADVMAHLASSPPSITSPAEIDAEFAAMPVAY